MTSVLRSLLNAGAPRPEIGYELVDDRGEIVAMAELAWPAVRVALLTTTQETCRAPLEKANWRVPSPDIPIVELIALLNRPANSRED